MSETSVQNTENTGGINPTTAKIQAGSSSDSGYERAIGNVESASPTEALSNLGTTVSNAVNTAILKSIEKMLPPVTKVLIITLLILGAVFFLMKGFNISIPIGGIKGGMKA